MKTITKYEDYQQLCQDLLVRNQTVDLEKPWGSFARKNLLFFKVDQVIMLRAELVLEYDPTVTGKIKEVMLFDLKEQKIIFSHGYIHKKPLENKTNPQLELYNIGFQDENRHLDTNGLQWSLVITTETHFLIFNRDDFIIDHHYWDHQIINSWNQIYWWDTTQFLREKDVSLPLGWEFKGHDIKKWTQGVLENDGRFQTENQKIMQDLKQRLPYQKTIKLYDPTIINFRLTNPNKDVNDLLVDYLLIQNLEGLDQKLDFYFVPQSCSYSDVEPIDYQSYVYSDQYEDLIIWRHNEQVRLDTPYLVYIYNNQNKVLYSFDGYLVLHANWEQTKKRLEQKLQELNQIQQKVIKRQQLINSLISNLPKLIQDQPTKTNEIQENYHQRVDLIQEDINKLKIKQKELEDTINQIRSKMNQITN